MLCIVSGFLYNANGQPIRQGKITARLQQDIVTPDGLKVAPIAIEQSLAPLSAPRVTTITNVGAAGSTTYHYQVTAVDGAGGESLLSGPYIDNSSSILAQTTTGNATLSSTNYNRITWTDVAGAVQYKVYGRTLQGPTLIGVTTSAFFDDTGANLGYSHPGINNSGGYVYIKLEPTVGSTPAGVAYFVEYDPDPDDLSQPARTKDGYWTNYWAVPSSPSVNIGNFASAQRGAPYANYMPIGGTISTLSDTASIGAGTNTTKTLQANIGVGGSQPAIRFNVSTSLWEYSNNGTTWLPFGTVVVYTHQQSTASATWTVTHNRGIKGLSVTVTNLSDQVVFPDIITYTNVNTITLTFSAAMTGFAYVR